MAGERKLSDEPIYFPLYRSRIKFAKDLNTIKAKLFCTLNLLHEDASNFLLSKGEVVNIPPLKDPLMFKLDYIHSNAKNLFKHKHLAAGSDPIRTHVFELKELVRESQNKICHLRWECLLNPGHKALFNRLHRCQHLLVVEMANGKENNNK